MSDVRIEILKRVSIFTYSGTYGIKMKDDSSACKQYIGIRLLQDTAQNQMSLQS